MIKDGAYGLSHNRVVIRNGNNLEPVSLSRAVETRIRALMRLCSDYILQNLPSNRGVAIQQPIDYTLRRR